MATQDRTRVIHLVRHAHYVTLPDGDRLSALGRKQARRLAEHLRGVELDHFDSSVLSRAVETARILSERAAMPPLRIRRIWHEILPSTVTGMHVSLEKRRRGRAALERLLETRLRPSSKPQNELIVTHGNLIRALVCRVLGAPASAWVRLRICHCSITRIAISRDGSMIVRSFADTSHLNRALVTWK